MTGENKFLIGIGIVTLAIILGGVFFLGKGKKPQAVDPNFDKSQLTQNAARTQGNPQAPITIVEFADLQCPACKQAQPILENIIEKNKDKVYFVFRHYPLSIHKNAKIAAQAAEAASAQGKFFEMVHLQYLKQAEWSEQTNPREKFRAYAQELGLNLDQFNNDMEKLKDQIESDYVLGNRAGVESTPTFFINGTKYPGVLQADQFQQLIDGAGQPFPQEATQEATSTSETPGQ